MNLNGYVLFCYTTLGMFPMLKQKYTTQTNGKCKRPERHRIERGISNKTRQRITKKYETRQNNKLLLLKYVLLPRADIRSEFGAFSF